MESKQGLPVVSFASQAAWETWLEANHATSQGLWLKIAKADSGVGSVSYPEALESAICYGWIDAQKASLDDQFWLQKFTPRGPRSKWSRLNCEKAADLLRQGRMKPPGLVAIEQARQDGRWDAAYEPQSRAVVPDDLQRELDSNPTARAFFEGLDSRNRYAILYRLHDAKKPETRRRRLEQFLAMLSERRRIYP